MFKVGDIVCINKERWCYYNQYNRFSTSPNDNLLGTVVEEDDSNNWVRVNWHFGITDSYESYMILHYKKNDLKQEELDV